MWHPSLLFSFPFLLFFFSLGIFYSFHVSSLRQCLQHVDQPLPKEGSAMCICHPSIFASSSLTAWPFFPLCLCGPHPTILLPSCLVMRLGTPCLRFYLTVVIFRSSIYEATCVQQMCTCDGCRLSRGPQVSWSWISSGEGESSKHPLPAHLETSPRQKRCK